MLSVGRPPAQVEVPVHPDLVYDVGLHQGEDTAYYLAKGYRVIAFEANRELAETCRRRFSAAIAAGRLEIVEGAITDSGDATVTFFVHSEKSDWGTTDPGWVDRNARMTGGSVREVVVPAVDFAATLARTGMPTFMKIDIEGADRVCLEALRSFTEVPISLSLESSKATLEDVAAELDFLSALGYTEFAARQQAVLPGKTISTRTRTGEPLTYTFDRHSSGPFGDDIHDWRDRDAVLARYRRIFIGYRLLGEQSRIHRNGLTRLMVGSMQHRLRIALPGWYDTHARRSPADGAVSRRERGGS
jgi:FkbM family methyltransferase